VLAEYGSAATRRRVGRWLAGGSEVATPVAEPA
jgi:hypothetical protein